MEAELHISAAREHDTAIWVDRRVFLFSFIWVNTDIACTIEGTVQRTRYFPVTLERRAFVFDYPAGKDTRPSTPKHLSEDGPLQRVIG